MKEVSIGDSRREHSVQAKEEECFTEESHYKPSETLG